MASNPRRLSYGEYDLPTHLATRNTASHRFLEIASRRYPCLLDTLAGIEVVREDFGEDVVVLAIGTALVEEAPGGDPVRWERVVGAVEAWAEAHRIASPFIRNAALFTLYHWTREPRHRDQRMWVFPEVTWHIPPTALTSTLPEPITEDWETARARWRGLWDARVAELEQRGYRPSRLKDADHFDWLARVLIGRESVTQVSKVVHRARGTVSDAIRETAALLDLALPRGAERARTR